MPVTPAQQAIIEQSIEHLVTIPETKASLSGYIRSLKTIFSKVTDEQQEDLRLLHQCFQKPMTFFSNLEKTNRTITQGDVQEVIIRYLSRCLEPAARTLSIDVLHLGWDQKQLLSTVKLSDHYQRPFETVARSMVVEEHPYFLAPENQRFKLHFIPETNPPIVTLHLTVDTDLGEVNETSDVSLHEMLENVGQSSEPYETRIATRQFTDNILKKASVLAGGVLVSMLNIEELVDTFLCMECSDSAKALVSYQHYYSAIRDQTIDFAEVAFIEQDDFATLSNPAIARLIPDTLSIREVCALRKAERMILSHPFYSQALINEKIKLDWFHDVKMKQARMLVSSYVMNLIQLNVLTYYQAIKCVSKEVYSLMSSEFHYASLKQGRVAFRDIKHIGSLRTGVLLDEKIIKLLANKIMEYSDALSTPLKLIRLIMANDLLFHYLEAGVVSIKQLNKMLIIDEMNNTAFDKLTASEMIVAKRFMPKFLQLAEHGLLSLSHLSLFHGLIKSEALRIELPLSIHTLLQIPAIKVCCELQMTHRVQALIDKQPQVFSHRVTDSFEMILAGSEACRFDFKKIRNELLDRGIRDHLENKGRLFYAIFEARKKLGISDLTLYSHLVGARLYALFENNPYRVLGRLDTLGVLQELMDSYSAKYSPYLTIDSLTASTIQYFLRKVLQHIESTGPIQNESVATVYREIASLVKKADAAASHHTLEIESLSGWTQAFSEIIKITSSRQSTSHVAQSVKSGSYKRLKLFGGPFGDSLSSEHQLRQFCERFSGLAGLTRDAVAMDVCVHEKSTSFR